MEKIDLTYLNQMSDGDKNLIIELTQIYKTQIPEFINQLQQAYNTKNWEKLAAIAHKAKSSVSIVGLNKLATSLKTLELDAKKAINTENYQNIITNFKETTLASINELEDAIKNKL